MSYDKILEEIGEFGKFQKINYLLICLPVIFAAGNSLTYVFTAGIPQYRCFIPECEQRESARYEEPWIDHAVPGMMIRGGFQPANCMRFAPQFRNMKSQMAHECPKESFSGATVWCDEWVFDMTERTIVQEWQITCFANQWKLSMVGTVHFAGLIVGSGVFGILADKIGRKIVLIICATGMAIFGILQGIAWDYLSFMIFTFVNAVFAAGIYPVAFILGVEMVGPSKREMAGVVLNYFFAVGEALLGVIAYLARDWEIILIGISAPSLLFFTYYWLIPESVRWLISKKKI